MKSLSPAALIAAALAPPAPAQSAGDWTVASGAGSVMPKDDNGIMAGTLKSEVGDDIRPSVTVEYFICDNLRGELLAATPFEHDVRVKGVGRVGSVKHLPPVLSLNHHLDTGSPFRPYPGFGIKYTGF